jgi:hypothetical protein
VGDLGQVGCAGRLGRIRFAEEHPAARGSCPRRDPPGCRRDTNEIPAAIGSACPGAEGAGQRRTPAEHRRPKRWTVALGAGLTSGDCEVRPRSRTSRAWSEG